MSPQGGIQTRTLFPGWGWGSVHASVDSPGCTHAGDTPSPGPEVVDLLGQALGECWVGVGAMVQPTGSLESLSPPLSRWVPQLPETRLLRKRSP